MLIASAPMPAAIVLAGWLAGRRHDRAAIGGERCNNPPGEAISRALTALLARNEFRPVPPLRRGIAGSIARRAGMIAQRLSTMLAPAALRAPAGLRPPGEAISMVALTGLRALTGSLTPGEAILRILSTMSAPAAS
jgi:hypothetical protein